MFFLHSSYHLSAVALLQAPSATLFPCHMDIIAPESGLASNVDTCLCNVCIDTAMYSLHKGAHVTGWQRKRTVGRQLSPYNRKPVQVGQDYQNAKDLQKFKPLQTFCCSVYEKKILNDFTSTQIINFTQYEYEQVYRKISSWMLFLLHMKFTIRRLWRFALFSHVTSLAFLFEHSKAADVHMKGISNSQTTMGGFI